MRDQRELQQHQIAAAEKLPKEILEREFPADSTLTHVEQHDYDYYKQVFAGRPMPFVYLDLDLFEQNIRQVVQRADGKRIRLASKSLRSVDVIRRILASNPCFQGIMCYSTREAVYLASQGFDDLLIGYPAWNKLDIAPVAQSTSAGSCITPMVE